MNKKWRLLKENGLWGVGTTELNQPVYFKSVLTSYWKSENSLHWMRGLPLFPQETKAYDFLQNKKRSDLTRVDLLKILATDIKEETKKEYSTDDM